MFQFTRDITLKDIQEGARDVWYCRKHRLSFNPAVGSCAKCGELRPPQLQIVPSQDIPNRLGSSPAWPNTITVPYTGPFIGGGYGGTTDNTRWGHSTFTVTSTTSSNAAAGTISYDATTGLLSVNDGTRWVGVGGTL